MYVARRALTALGSRPTVRQRRTAEAAPPFAYAEDARPERAALLGALRAHGLPAHAACAQLQARARRRTRTRTRTSVHACACAEGT
jgi:hypothetical protein